MPKKEENKLKLDVPGEDHTLCNILRQELWNDKHVAAAGYNIDHPMAGEPWIFVETDGEETPKQAVIKAIDRLDKQTNELRDKIKKIKF